MKFISLLVLAAVFTLSLNAQSRSSIIFGDALMRDKKMIKTGTALTFVGSTLLLTGNILYWKAYNKSGTKEAPENKAGTYANLMLGGFGLMAIGIPLWTAGKINERHITIQAELVNFNGLASANGIGLKVSF